jgi:hypothetical protein
MRIPAAGGQPVYDGLDSTSLTGSVALPRLAAEAMIHSIDLSPDGSRVAFTANTQAINELWTLQNVGAFLSGKR